MFGDSWEVFGGTVLEVFGRFSYMGDGGGEDSEKYHNDVSRSRYRHVTLPLKKSSPAAGQGFQITTLK